ncbi:MAG TPA: hypothetical protein VGO96_21500 [Pyrinomonadaceae bacterium]|jgi:hypothetical protein|nr:hypothetical protein [Pyrinomonadaceae bacterium]
MRSFAVLSIALAFAFLLAPRACGQSAASVTIGGRVGEAIFVSIAPGAQVSGDTLPVTYTNLDQHTVRLSIPTSGTSGGSRRLSIPLQLRSNVGYTLSASANSNGTTLLLRELCVAGVKATGRHVARGATHAANMAACADRTARVQTGDANRSGASFPATLLQGQPISLSGTSDSPFNALEVLISIEVETQTGQPQGNVELTLSATPRSVASPAMNDVSKR